MYAALVLLGAIGYEACSPRSKPAALAAQDANPKRARPFVEYRDAQVGLSREYNDYDDYKNDPDNLAIDERVRAANLVRGARPSEVVPDVAHVFQVVSDLEFPGYGMVSFGQKDMGDGTSLLGFSIEVPTAGQDRLVVYLCKTDACRLADDTLVSDELPIIEVRLAGSELVYRSRDQKDLLRRPLRRAP